ncbi:hypothetical protein CDD83_4397 [Cordyceps sp. RAO-2017]|nr:hypothetical protein CDD83_4397 [Cordyceps sp. RAO-2017]
MFHLPTTALIQSDDRYTAIAKYDMVLSKKRLEEEGFHPEVTTKTREELLAIGANTIIKYTSRLSRQQLLDGNPSHPEGFTPFRRLTRALLLFRKGFGNSRFGEEEAAASTTVNLLVRLLDTIDVGGTVSEQIFADGYKTVQSVAMTSTDSWFALAASTKIWDFFAADFHVEGPASAFIAVAPEYTLGEFRHAQKYDPCGLDGSSPLSAWFADAIKAEEDIYVSLSQLHRRLSKKRRREPRLGELTEYLVKHTRQLADVKLIHGSNQFNSTEEHRVFDPSAYFAVTRLQQMLGKIFQRRAGIEVLYFQKIPFLDRRIVAVVLRACPRVQMIGIYDCPLIHFGDVLCLLDLIYDVNQQRRKDGLAPIRAFDFFPRYHEGMPFAHERAATYGLTWGPHSREVVQRGFFGIVLQAFFKARAMKLDLLFSKGKAFGDFLAKVPHYTLAVPSFLDGLYRYADLQRSKRTGPDGNKLRQALYDMLKPVRIGLEKPDSDWPHYYSEIMGSCLLFCSSCGYEMLEEFFTARYRENRPHNRVCATCLLRLRLDEESDHLKEHKLGILTSLLPDWNGLEFNRDAPVGAEAGALLRLKSTEPRRPPPPPMVINNDGHVFQPNYVMVKVRDRKVHYDSLQGLPSLGELVEPGRWTKAIDGCHQLDMYSRLVWRLRDESLESGRRGKDCVLDRIDGGMPDHAEELQPPKFPGVVPAYNFADVVVLETRVYNKGWL